MGIAKRVIKRLAPGIFQAAKRRYKAVRFRFGHGGSEYRSKRALVKRYGKQVLTGPFQGMRYGDDVACSAYVAKLVGSYEQELHAIIGDIIGEDYRAVIDVGCAEGYYAVGFAFRMPSTTVYAFDTDLEAQKYCASLAELNGVGDRIKVLGLCDHESLRKLCDSSTLILCDCEGFEAELLDPERVPELRTTDILVELHEFIVPGVTEALLSRFHETHAVQLVDTVERRPEDYPVLNGVAPEDRYWAVREGRPTGMQWAYFTQRAK
jgi:hypothetical protein